MIKISKTSAYILLCVGVFKILFYYGLYGTSLLKFYSCRILKLDPNLIPSHRSLMVTSWYQFFIKVGVVRILKLRTNLTLSNRSYVEPSWYHFIYHVFLNSYIQCVKPYMFVLYNNKHSEAPQYKIFTSGINFVINGFD